MEPREPRVGGGGALKAPAAWDPLACSFPRVAPFPLWGPEGPAPPPQPSPSLWGAKWGRHAPLEPRGLAGVPAPPAAARGQFWELVEWPGPQTSGEGKAGQAVATVAMMASHSSLSTHSLPGVGRLPLSGFSLPALNQLFSRNHVDFGTQLQVWDPRLCKVRLTISDEPGTD